MITSIVEINNSAVAVKSVGNLAQSWLNHLRGKMPKTKATYETAIRQWIKYCGAKGIVNPTTADVEIWIDSLLAAKKAVSTINLYRSAVRVLYTWTAKEKLYPNITAGVEGVKTRGKRRHKKSALTATQGGSLIKAVEGDRLVDKRNRAIIALTLTAGLRTIEINRADVQDIHEEEGRHYLKVQGKGRLEKDEYVMIAAQVYQLIEDYLNARGNGADDEPLFASTRRNKGGRLSTQSISKMIKKNLRGLGLKGKEYSAHSLRHSAACQMVIAGVELRHVQAVLRHSNISTTMIYLDTVDRLTNTAEQTVANAFFAA